MTFVDTNIFVYAVGRQHPLRERARTALQERMTSREQLCTSAEVLQELLHIYLPVERLATLDAALRLASELGAVWPIDADDVRSARSLMTRHRGLSARDLLHLAVCHRYRVDELLSFDRALVASFGSRS